MKKHQIIYRGDYPCQDCGIEENIVWFTDNIFWNSIMRDNKVANENCSGILCVNCFVKRAEKKFKVRGWKLTPEWKWETSDQIN